MMEDSTHDAKYLNRQSEGSEGEAPHENQAESLPSRYLHPPHEKENRAYLDVKE